MSLFSNFFGSIDTGDLSYFRDGRLASFNYGQTNNYYELNAPRMKFLYFVRIDFNPAASDFTKKYFKTSDVALLIPLVKAADQPSMKVTTTTLNQYNKRRIAQQNIKFNPIKLTFQDVADGKVLRLWEMNYEYYYRNGVNENKVDRATKSFASTKFANDVYSSNYQSGDSGYNINKMGRNKQLFNSISIYQVNGGNYSKVMLVNPTITDFNPSNLSYSESALCDHVFTFEYEDAVYYNYVEPLQGEDWQVFGNSGFRELNPTAPRIKLNIENRCGTASSISANGKVEDDSFFGKLAGAFGDTGKSFVSDILNVGVNLGSNVEGFINNLPGMLASSVKTGILTGDFSFPVNLSSAGHNVLDQVKRETIGSGVRAAGVLVGGTSGAVTDTFNDVFLDNPRQKNVTLEQSQQIKAAKEAQGPQ